MPKKQVKNSFYFYMQELLPELQRQGRVFPNGMADVVPIAHPRWKDLPAKDKERFEEMAKEYKRRMRGAEGDRWKMDNVGNILSERKNVDDESKHRRAREKKYNTANWTAGKDICDEKFYFIDFQCLCKTEDKEWLPAEIGIIEYSMTNGISKLLHKFIQPGRIPTGYRFECQNTSDTTHKIPIEGFKLADDNYMGIWVQLENFINPNGEKEEYPPLYTLGSETARVHYCLKWIHSHTTLHQNTFSRLKKVFELEGLFLDLCAYGEKPISLGSGIDQLTSHAYDYESNTRCNFHEEAESNYCALADCKKRAYSMSETLAGIFDFQLTVNHLPQHDDTTTFTVIKPGNAPQHIKTKATNALSSGGKNAYGAMSNQKGSFGGVDYRYTPEEEEEEDDFEPVSKPPMRRPNAPGMNQAVTTGYAPATFSWAAATQQAPRQSAPLAQPAFHSSTSRSSSWVTTTMNNSSQIVPSMNQTDFPMLGGIGRGIPQQQPAGFQGAPPPSHAPQPPSAWQNTNQLVQGSAQYSSANQTQAAPRPAWNPPAPPAQSSNMVEQVRPAMNLFSQQQGAPMQPQSASNQSQIPVRTPWGAPSQPQVGMRPACIPTHPAPWSCSAPQPRMPNMVPQPPQSSSWSQPSQGQYAAAAPVQPGATWGQGPPQMGGVQQPASGMFAGAGRGRGRGMGRGRGVFNPSATNPAQMQDVSYQMQSLQINKQ